MARASSVEYNQVAQACYSLFQAGAPVSFQRVYDLLDNKGSSRVVNDYIKRWRQEAGDKLAVTFARSLPGLPEGLVSAADDLLLKFWQGALAQAEQAYQTAQQELAQERSALEVERETEKATVQELLTAKAQLTSELHATQTSLAEKVLAIQEAKAHNQEQEAALREQGAQISALREAVARLAGTLEAVQRQHAEDLTEAHARAEALLAVARQAHQQELEREREVAAGERNYLMQSTDEIRQAAKHTEAQLRNELADTKVLNDAYRRQTAQAADESARWRGRAESAEALVERFTTRKQRRPPEPNGVSE